MKFSKIPFFLFLLRVLLVPASQVPLNREGPSSVLGPDIDDFINQLLQEWTIPGGLSVAVVRKSPESALWITEIKGYGRAKEDGTAIDENTLFSIGSNSKLFNILATGQLISNESLSPRLSWDTKIASIFPEWGHLDDPFLARQASIADLMSHRTGIPSHDFSCQFNDSMKDTLLRLKNIRPSTEFRWAWQYSNIQYTLLSHIPTAVLPTKPSFVSYVKQNLLLPLALNSTTYSFDEANASGKLADGFSKNEFNFWEDPYGLNATVRVWPYWDQHNADGNAMSGPGGVISSAKDMATWAKMLLLKGLHPDSEMTIIPPTVIDTVTSGISVLLGVGSFPEFGPMVYGGALARSSYRGKEIVTHDGGVPGFKSNLLLLPNDNLGIVVLTNDDLHGQALHQVVTWRIADKALGLRPVDWKTRFEAIISAIGQQRKPAPPPSNPAPPSVPVEQLAGKYFNAGYQKIEFCALAMGGSPATSTSCTELLQDLNTTLPGVWASIQLPTYIAQWKSPWITHVKLTHFDGNVFNLTALSSIPVNNITKSSDRYWVQELQTPWVAEFGGGDENGDSLGVALNGGIWGASPSVAPQGKTLKERAEVWFTKL